MVEHQLVNFSLWFPFISNFVWCYCMICMGRNKIIIKMKWQLLISPSYNVRGKFEKIPVESEIPSVIHSIPVKRLVCRYSWFLLRSKYPLDLSVSELQMNFLHWSIPNRLGQCFPFGFLLKLFLIAEFSYFIEYLCIRGWNLCSFFILKFLSIRELPEIQIKRPFFAQPIEVVLALLEATQLKSVIAKKYVRK